MKKILVLFCLCTLLFPVSPVWAQGPGSSGVLFLLIAPGARAAGMGESFVAIADDATATYWNPAGLAFQERTQIALMHSNWLPELASDLYYDYATIVRPMGNIGTAGLSLTFINLGTQIITGETSPDPLGEFSSYELALAGSWGTKLSANSAAGVTLKFIYSNLAPRGAGAEQGDGRATAFAVDLGYLHRNLLIDRFNFGVNLTNVGPKISYIDAAQADPLPTNLRLGFSYHLIKQEFNSLMIATEFDRLLVAPRPEGGADPVFKALVTAWTDEPLKDELKHIIYNIGAEYWYNNFVALRTGYHYDRVGRVKYVSFGAGLKYSSLGLDFGYVSAGEGHPLSNTMRISLGIGL
ncbi:MAG: PorV/PorQ family protein [candidate division KSB1 bacterium]|nr:PorV/PorQ family protein [candidate division KSB1 bacterium]MDZ7272482.1 PorV/PorQ family protein [candidate division KSB1 bacterium]MDZ7284494.1 PorV/PorQ family protein [candidate division KSB1 bacterium]MDZ7297110.1 PorV/PorQ family protein [candidate division KSB1 bacterium]MDZ7306558.1 PorV/PorQ family protein [candidate division KSB1 bacterium]